MKIFIKLSVLGLALFWNIQVQAQCTTPSPDYDQIMTTEEVNAIMAQKNGLYEAYTVRLMFHLIRHADGSDGPSEADVMAQMAILESNFAQADVCFVLVGIKEILNNAYAETGDYLGLTSGTLYPTYGNTNRIDLFVFPATLGDLSGNAFAIPNDYLAMSEARFGTSQNMSHEVGHCLNLLHTHEQWGASCPSIFLEQVDGGNCTTGGDLCCDTPADPNIDGTSTTTCNYTGGATDCEGNTYNPQENNFMSYGWSCRSNFSACQINRIKAELSSGTKGTAYRASDNVVVSNSTYSSGSHYQASGLTIQASNNYNVNGSADMLHIATGSIRLLPGVHIDPAANGEYKGKINENCN